MGRPKWFPTFRSAFILGSGPRGSVGIATDYRLDGPGIESRWRRDFPPVETGPGAHPSSCTMGTGSFPGVKCGCGVLLTPHLLLAPRFWKSRAIPLPPLWATTGPVTGLLYFYLHPRSQVVQAELKRLRRRKIRRKSSKQREKIVVMRREKN